MFLNGFSTWINNFGVLQGLDLAISLFIIYELYRIIRRTSAVNIILSLVFIYIAWLISWWLYMPILTKLLNQIVSVGVIGLVIIFQPELRRFLFMLSSPGAIKSKGIRLLKKSNFIKNYGRRPLKINQIIQACMHMSHSKVGALIILTQENKLPSVAATGEYMDSEISSALIETVFFKNSPLHDGAMIVVENKILASRCILPVSSNKGISANLGLRHRSAIGATEQSDAIAIIVSEETGSISYSMFGEITYNVSPSGLRMYLEEFFFEAQGEGE